MSDQLQTKFEKATKHLPNLLGTIASTDLLYLYARYKQANEGQCSTPKPGFFDFQGKQKWEAWKSLGELASIDAMMQYIEKMNSLDPGWQGKEEEKAAGTAATKSTTSWVNVSVMVEPEDLSLPDEQKTIFDWCKEGNIERIVPLLTDIHPDMPGDEGMTLLHWACDRGHERIVELLIQRNADVNITDSNGQTPLHYASSCGHVGIVQILLRNKADPSVEDDQGDTPEKISCDEDTKKLFSSWSYWKMELR